MSICADRTGAENKLCQYQEIFDLQTAVSPTLPTQLQENIDVACSIVVFINALLWNPVTCLKKLMNINLQIRQTYCFVVIHTWQESVMNVMYYSHCYVFILIVMYYSYCCFILIVMYYSYCYVCSVHSVFIVPTGTLRLPWLRFFRALSSVVRQMPGYNSQRQSTARTLLN